MNEFLSSLWGSGDFVMSNLVTGVRPTKHYKMRTHNWHEKLQAARKRHRQAVKRGRNGR